MVGFTCRLFLFFQKATGSCRWGQSSWSFWGLHRRDGPCGLEENWYFLFPKFLFFSLNIIGFGSVRILGVTPLGSSRSRLRAPLYGTPDYFHLGIGSPYFYLHWRSSNLPGIAISAGGDEEPDFGWRGGAEEGSRLWIFWRPKLLLPTTVPNLQNILCLSSGLAGTARLAMLNRPHIAEDAMDIGKKSGTRSRDQ